ncbi:hypothetical protein PspLS_08193 [Pyricularia sp. CBS 133598]|nr:hypothetical protein PspLS_08193 [Pyricularia sp. CBS 133598]
MDTRILHVTLHVLEKDLEIINIPSQDPRKQRDTDGLNPLQHIVLKPQAQVLDPAAFCPGVEGELLPDLDDVLEPELAHPPGVVDRIVPAAPDAAARLHGKPSGGGVRNLKGMMGSRICSQPPGARLDMADSMTARGERKHVTTARMWIKSKGKEKSHSSSASQIWKEQFGGT